MQNDLSGNPGESASLGEVGVIQWNYRDKPERVIVKYQLFTSSYGKFTSDLGTPIRTSKGGPKFKISYDLRWALMALAPDYRLWGKNISNEKFQEGYWADLDKIGIDALDDVFTQLSEQTGEKRLVLLCFEKTQAQCHRGDFARWWERETGITVPEVPK